MTRIPMTVQGEKALREELVLLKTVKRPQVIESISTAREHGDLKENAEYHAAREQQSFIEGRIQEVEAKLSNSQVIDILAIPYSGKVIFGTTVSLINVETEANVRYHIVGDDEANIKAGKISISSPISRAIIGKEEGDVVGVKVPNGIIEYEIDEVFHI